MIARNWIIADPADIAWQEKFPAVHPITRQLLWNRNVRDAEAIGKFLNPSYEDLYDPFLFKDMEKVVARLNRAIEAGEKIFVYGDYDADGVPGAVIIVSALEELWRRLKPATTPQLGIYIPHREREGYGLNSGAISYMLEQGGKVVITCDCGISNASETAEAMGKGLDVIITDHHRIPEVVPSAFAILHPLIPGEVYPNKYLTGGGVAFKLAQGLLRECKIKNEKCKIVDLLVECGLTGSKGEARRVIEQGGVQVDGKVVSDPTTIIKLTEKGVLIQKGKRHFVRVVSS